MHIDSEIRNLFSGSSESYLGTLEEGWPYVSMVSFLHQSSETDEIFYLLLSDLARHTKNIKNNPQVSLLITFRDPAKTFYETPRLTVQGKIEPVTDKGQLDELRRIYPQVEPQAEMFLQLPDFKFYGLVGKCAYWVGGFGKAREFS